LILCAFSALVSVSMLSAFVYEATTNLEVFNIHEGGFMGALKLLALAIAFGAVAFAAYPDQKSKGMGL
jgi:H+/gluconate symporter-like permease